MTNASDKQLEIAARQAIAAGSQSFSAAARLLSPTTRRDATLLYFWCRYCDDRIDGQTAGHDRAVLNDEIRRQRLAQLRKETEKAVAGRQPSELPFAALQTVVERHRIPARYPRDLLTGFEMDVEGRRFETIDESLTYCYHVAGVVGVMMAMVMGVRERAVLASACDLGLAFQLTNIARDVIEDADAGHVYLPGLWLDEAGVPRDAVCRVEHRQSVWQVVARLLQTADLFYASSLAGLSALPLRDTHGIATARAVYRDIGRVLRARGATAWDRRAAIGRPRKAVLALGAIGTTLRSRWIGGANPLVRTAQAPAARFSERLLSE